MARTYTEDEVLGIATWAAQIAMDPNDKRSEMPPQEIAAAVIEEFNREAEG